MARRVGREEKQLTLPEGDKNDWLDHEELEYWFKWSEDLTAGKVEEEESVEGKTDRDVVDNHDVEIAIRYPAQ